jgi:hypothetical protein
VAGLYFINALIFCVAPKPPPVQKRAPVSTAPRRPPIQPKEIVLPVFIDEWITKPRGGCLPPDDIWDGTFYNERPRDIPEGMEYRTLNSGRGYLAKKRPGGFFGLPMDSPAPISSKRSRLGDGGLSTSTSTSAPTNPNLPHKSIDSELLIPHASTSKPPPPLSTGGTKSLAESQKIDESTKKDTLLKTSQTYKTMQVIVAEEAAKNAAEEKEREMKVSQRLAPCFSCPLIDISRRNCEKGPWRR